MRENELYKFDFKRENNSLKKEFKPSTIGCFISIASVLLFALGIYIDKTINYSSTAMPKAMPIALAPISEPIDPPFPELILPRPLPVDTVLPPLKISEQEIELMNKNKRVINEVPLLPDEVLLKILLEYEQGQKPTGKYEKILNEAFIKAQISKFQAQKAITNMDYGND